MFLPAVLALLIASPGDGQSFPINGPAHEITGALVICGGGKLPAGVFDRFIELAGGPKSKLVIIPTADVKEPVEADVLAPWRKRGPAEVIMLHTRSRQRANAPDFVKPLADATGVWLGGGDQRKLAAAYRGTRMEGELRKLLGRGGVIGGTSAGAAVMSRLMIAASVPRPVIAPGFGLLDNVVIDQHFLKRNRVNRLVEVLAAHPGWAGLGIDEQTAVVIRGRTMTVLGNSYAMTCLSASSNRPARFQVLMAGKEADLVALTRAAVERTQPPFPGAKPPVPTVPRGTLIIGGGGGMPREVWKRFIGYAGGPDAAILVIPTAYADPVPKAPSEARALRAAGAKNVTVLHARTPAEAERPAFLAAIAGAKGIWFTGGRQWRFVDAYLDTKAQKAFHAVLDRGGVIGGSSAGASIQAAYMVRGDPLGNLNISAEGYERGLAFLPGAAVDQHFFKRKRTKDMTELMAVHPQLLGIGIDEGTVIVVRGDIMEVVGKSKVAVYDRRRPVQGERDFEVLNSGDRFDMRARRKIMGTSTSPRD